MWNVDQAQRHLLNDFFTSAKILKWPSARMTWTSWVLLSSVIWVLLDNTKGSSLQTTRELTQTKEVATNFQTHETPAIVNLRHGKKRKRKQNKRLKPKHKSRFASARRYFEKQLLVRNKTLALLGGEFEKILHSSSGVQSPLRKWYSNKLNHTLKDTLDLNQSRGEVSSLHDTNTLEYQYDYKTFTLKDDTVTYPINFQNSLSHLLDVLENSSIEVELDETPCEQWMDCHHTLQKAFLSSLPACPCHYPSGIFYEDKLWDKNQDQHFRWRDASGERLDVYKPGAEYCIRSLLPHNSISLAAQHCCYDKNRRLITRGSGAGNPNFVSPDVSVDLHDKVDILPWRLCKGDFTRYNRVRPPNNGNNCETNPKDEEFILQVEAVKFF
uniref:AMOP domain-containing protein n=2 Tax=Clastoptera arizonana TaxID=38151 RepID=A0A1B6E4X2_9HEMI